MSYLTVSYALKKFRSSPASLEGSIISALDFVFSPYGFCIRPNQIRSEIEGLMKLLMEIRPKTILEIGRAQGGTLFLFCRVASPDAKIMSLDLPAGDRIFNLSLYQLFTAKNQTLHLVRASSHEEGTLKRIKEGLHKKPLDFLFIDGDHSYEGVKRDFEMYSSLVRKGGVVAFHDIIPDYSTRYGSKTTSWSGGVHQFWNEIRNQFRVLEIVNDTEQDGYGVGVLFVD